MKQVATPAESDSAGQVKQLMKILGIETSCDETAAAVVEDGTKILSNVLASSAEMHAKTGGIIPEQAARQQVRSIVPVIQEALTNESSPQQFNNSNNLTIAKWLNGYIAKNIDAIAVTIGPGLIGSLLVGVETAKTLSFLWNKPMIPVNHLAAHIYANWLTPNSKLKIKQSLKLPKFPALALVVSGGHTDLVLMKDHGQLKWLGGTRDDAAGEAFDKCARLLGLPYPGGPAISATSEKFQITNSKLQMFPRPMMDEDNFDWSFSGLKTAVLRKTEELKNEKIKRSLSLRDKKLSKKTVSDLAAEIQEAIVDCLVEKSIRAIKLFKPRSFLLAGGVAANKRLREKFLSRIKDEKLQVYFHVPIPSLCTDNATYIASYAFYNFHPVDWRKVTANPGLTIVGEI